MKGTLWLNSLALVLLICFSLFFAPALGTSGPQNRSLSAGAVYVMTNDSAGNEVVVYDRAADGALTKIDAVSTQGTGFGGGFDPLASQGSLVLSGNGRWLLAVNAGSNDISVFRVGPRGLEFKDRISSGGTMPVSLTVSSSRVYVLNAGGTANISGFILGSDGEFHAIPDSTRELGSGAFSQVGFNNLGTQLVVTDRAENEILVYNTRSLIPSANPVTNPSNGPTPFSFIFDNRDRLLVVEVNDNNGAVTSYRVGSDGSLDVISGSVTSGQAAACWIAGNNRGDMYTTNPASSSISAYGETPKGEVRLRDATAAIGAPTLDAGLSINGQFLYALNPAAGGVEMYRVNNDGGLISLGLAPGGLAVYAQGLAAR
jgi:6-phosphogluconolactonase (cycloisomerase 2 family)